MSVHIFIIKLSLQGPVLPRGTAKTYFGVDTSILREGGRINGTPIIPGSHVLGKLKQAWQELGGVNDAKENDVWFSNVQDWLGRSGFIGKDASAQRKRLTLGDLKADRGGEPDGQRVRIKIDQDTGVVVTGALQIIEAPFATGSVVTFCGQGQFIGSRDDFTELLRLIELGLNWTQQFGGERSVGFGRNLGCCVVEDNRNRSPIIPSLDEDGLVGYVLKPSGPFCFPEHTYEGGSRNTFYSADNIPGNAIKGALAEIGAVDALGEAFDVLRVTHAKPGKKSGNEVGRSVALPQSFVMDVKGKLYDAALQAEPALLNAAAPAFPIDWKSKHYATADALLGTVSLGHELRIHTAIDPDKRRAKTADLFAYDMATLGDEQCLSGWLDLSDIDENERENVLGKLADLLQNGLPGLGKTGMHADIEFVQAAKIKPSVQHRLDLAATGKNVWVVTLQTHALLACPDAYQNDPQKDPQKTLHDAYAAAWTDITDGALQLSHYFSWESLWGGSYFAYRYFADQAYCPYVLTNPGSVFVLKAAAGKSNDVVQKALKKMLKHGLSVPQAVLKDLKVLKIPQNGSDLWSKLPFIAQNGFGEVSVNLNYGKFSGGKWTAVVED